MRWLRSLLVWLRLSEPLREPAPEPPPLEPADPGYEFHFASEVLGKLARAERIVRRMRRADPGAYEFYSRYGARVLPSAARYDFGGRLDPNWLAARPAFGMLLFGADEHAAAYDGRGTDYVPHALYYTKFAQHLPAHIQRTRGEVYVLNVYWDKPEARAMRRGGVAISFPLSVGAEGEVEALRVRQGRGQWALPSPLRSWAAQHGVTPQQLARETFVAVANGALDAELQMTRVRARRGDVCLNFAVDVLRTPGFFADRGLQAGPTGRRRRIFHIVRAHRRANGSLVRTHFRGTHKFDWEGYRVEISVPGWHSIRTAELPVGAMDRDAALAAGERPESLIDEAGVAEELRRIEAEGLGRYRRRRP